MKSRAYVFLFEGFSDWEAALAMCEIRRQERFELVTVGCTPGTVTSQGGLVIRPDVRFEEMTAENTMILILPGGSMWERNTEGRFLSRLRELSAAGVIIAAISGGTLAVAKGGLLADRRHTSDSRHYLSRLAPGYAGGHRYANELAVTDRGVITASGLGYVEFTREILRILEIYDQVNLDIWFDMFKRGMIPDG